MPGALAITSITNFLLAGEVLFLAALAARTPKIQFSAAWFWAGMLLFMGLASLAGGVDHGIVEPAGLPRFFIQRLTWILMAGMTFCLLMTAVRQFFPARLQGAFVWIGLAQFAVSTMAALVVDDFRVVTVGYAPVVALFLILNFIGIQNGAGSWDMVVGLLIVVGASAIQAMGVDRFSPVDHNGIYHLLSMVGVVFLYRGGRRLKA